jgi:type II secretory pathway pseudopilin PulG
VIAIISVLAALLLPALDEALVTARNVACTNQMRQQNLSLQEYFNLSSERMMWVRSAGNPSTCEAVPGGTYSGYGLLCRAGLVADHHILFCPDVKVRSAWGGGDPEVKYRRHIESFPGNIAAGKNARQDYNLGWWGGAPTVTEYLSGAGYGRHTGGRKTRYWAADGWGAFPYYYKKKSHQGGLYCNLARLDGGVVTIYNYPAVQPQTGSYGYYYPNNDRPGWGWWRYFGSGLGVDE